MGRNTLTQPERASEAAGLTRGEVVGRYVVLSKLGAGGMGLVYAAYDPELDRKVAVKLLRSDVAGRGSEAAQRMQREARALAKLSHPNVVAVHDVGTRGTVVWIAMEFVAGQTLAAWLKEKKRSWAEVLEVLRSVARGLAAAHEAGLVHRDVKPDNVMLDFGGNHGVRRARVMDFGLVRGAAAQTIVPDTAAEVRSAEQDSTELDAALTRAGAIPGTPAYMSPEQIAGEPTDARTDQFSFCVMLWEALYGQRPFVGESLAELATKIVEGERRSPPPGVRVPGWLRAVMDRGLSLDPDERWPSLTALLVALDRGQRRARTTRLFAGAGAAGLAAAGVLGWGQLQERQRIAACERAGAEIEDVWNDGTAEAVRTALRGTGVAHADATADKVTPWLEAQARTWRETRTAACLDAEVAQTWDADMHRRSQWCLDASRLELAALVERLRRADSTTVTKAVSAAVHLRTIEPCRDEALLSRLPAPPTESREAIQDLRAELSRADALAATGAYSESLAVAEVSLERAEALGWPPLVAAARRRVGKTLEKVGQYEKAEATLQQAYFEAAKAGATEDALDAANALAFTVGYLRARPEDGERWWKHAELMASELPDPVNIREARLLTVLGLLRETSGAYEQAAELHRRSLAMLETTLGPEHLDTVGCLNNLGNARQVQGAYEEAAQHFERALAITEALLGPEHPDVARRLNNLGLAHHRMGAYAKAAELHARALEIRERVLDPDHPDVATSLNNLAIARQSTGAYEEAAGLHARALDIRERVLGPDHPEVAASVGNLAGNRYAAGAYEEATALFARSLEVQEKALGPEHPAVGRALSNVATLRFKTGEYEEAAELFNRAITVLEASLGADHPELAESLNNVAAVKMALGSYDEATQLYERALAIREKGLGASHPDVAHPLVGLAQLALAQQRPADAVPLAERALNINERGDVTPLFVAEARLVLAQALVAAGGSRDRAVTLATQARDTYREAGPGHQKELAQAETLLREHAP